MSFAGFAAVWAAAGVLWLGSCGPRGPADPLPDRAAGGAWTKISETRAFAADDLWQYIDGEAERFIEAGVVRTLTADYRYGEELEAKIDVFVMSSADGARSLFEAEPAAGGRSADVGDAGRLYRLSLVFRRGPYFVRIIGYDETEDAPAALLALARAVDARLAQ